MKTSILCMLFSLTFTIPVFAIDEAFYKLSEKDSVETIKTKLKREARIDHSVGLTSIEFNEPQPFTISDKDLFEKIETPGGAKDIKDSKLLVADPETGRIFQLNRELKVVRLDLVKPWKKKGPLKTIKEILNSDSKVEKRK